MERFYIQGDGALKLRELVDYACKVENHLDTEKAKTALDSENYRREVVLSSYSGRVVNVRVIFSITEGISYLQGNLSKGVPVLVRHATIHVENGEIVPSREMVIELCKALGFKSPLKECASEMHPQVRNALVVFQVYSAD